MTYLVMQMLGYLLLTLFLGLLVGWLGWGRSLRGARRRAATSEREAVHSEERVEKLVARNRHAADEMAQVREALEQGQAELRSLRQEADSLQAKAAARERIAAPTQSPAARGPDEAEPARRALAATLAERSGELETAREEIAGLLADLEAVRVDLDESRAQRAADRRRLADLSDERQADSTRIVALETEIAKLGNGGPEDEAAHARIRELEAELRRSSARCHDLQSQTERAARHAEEQRERYDRALQKFRPRPVAGPEVRALDRDDLTQIHGVGPKLVRQLNSLGIFTFRQIALWDDADIDAIDQHLETFHGRIRRDGWVTDARQLHRDKYDEPLP